MQVAVLSIEWLPITEAGRLLRTPWIALSIVGIGGKPSASPHLC